MDKKLREQKNLEPVTARKDSPLSQFAEKVGKVEILEKEVGTKSLPTHGFFCATCRVSFTSSDAYLDHCNGRVHQKNIGLSLKVERVEEVDRVKARIQMLTKKQQQLKSVEKETVTLKQQRKERKKLKKSTNEGEESMQDAVEENNEDDLMASVMGFKSFS